MPTEIPRAAVAGEERRLRPRGQERNARRDRGAGSGEERRPQGAADREQAQVRKWILGVGLELYLILDPYFLHASMQMEKIEAQFTCWAGVALKEFVTRVMTGQMGQRGFITEHKSYWYTKLGFQQKHRLICQLELRCSTSSKVRVLYDI